MSFLSTFPKLLFTRGSSLNRLGYSAFYNSTYYHPFSTKASKTVEDDDGNVLSLEVTEAAANRLKYMAKRDNNPDQALRITVESGGCHGFQYLLDLTDKYDLEEDVYGFVYLLLAVFLNTNSFYSIFDRDGGKIVVDTISLGLISGSEIDFSEELIGSTFKVKNNPHAVSGCGCGTSFEVKF
ncbi:[4Fe-4S] proteins maturation [Basidiobolus ranarum]|uniref:[4Fe-4S] proteins maturation n=1 Tax=Basidiobolus ranarum TaxID=34480 RepID=A0ABR2WIN0_9FUNG